MAESPLYSICLAFEAGYEDVSTGKYSINPFPKDTQEFAAYELGQERGVEMLREQQRKFAALDKDRKFFRTQVVEHVKTHGFYKILAYGLNERNKSPVTVYEKVNDGQVWIRDLLEFEDGRFRGCMKSK